MLDFNVLTNMVVKTAKTYRFDTKKKVKNK